MIPLYFLSRIKKMRFSSTMSSFLMSVCFGFVSQLVLGQCDTTIPASQTCPSGAGTVSGGGTVNIGHGSSSQDISTRTRCVGTSATTTINTLNFNGQNQNNQTFELYIAGNLTINNNLQVNPAGNNNTFRIHILPGGSLTYAGNNTVNILNNYAIAY